MANEYGPYMDASAPYEYETVGGLRIRPRRVVIRFEPGKVSLYEDGTFISGGPYVHANVAHIAVGVEGCLIQPDGDLEIITDGMTPVMSNWCSPDETLSARGIVGGCSVGASTIVRFSKNGTRLYLNRQAHWDLISGTQANAWFGWDSVSNRS